MAKKHSKNLKLGSTAKVAGKASSSPTAATANKGKAVVGKTAATKIAEGAVYGWLVKSEPHVFSIDDLKRSPKKTTYWDGVRNYQARNMMRDLMKLGDPVLFYHSNTEEPAIVGTAKVVKTGYPDHTAFDATDPHFDPKSKSSNPTWFMVDIQLDQVFKRPLTLPMLRTIPELADMELLRRGSRLSVQPVTKAEFERVLAFAAE